MTRLTNYEVKLLALEITREYNDKHSDNNAAYEKKIKDDFEEYDAKYKIKALFSLAYGKDSYKTSNIENLIYHAYREAHPLRSEIKKAKSINTIENEIRKLLLLEKINKDGLTMDDIVSKINVGLN